MKTVTKLALASVSLLALSTPVFAQDAAPNAPTPGQATTATDQATAAEPDSDIVVTARRREESKQDVPLVVNAVSGQELQKLNIRDFKDITQVVPGLTLSPNSNGIGAQSQMRGINHDVNTTGNNGTIQYYLDDAPVSSDIVFQTMYDVGQIEVLRGPQGTLRGRATPSGSITITTHQPDLEEPGAYIDGTIASHDARNLNFGIGTPIIKDVLGVRVAGGYDFNRGNLVRSINDTIDQPYSRTRSLRASVRFEPVDWLKTGFTYLTIDHAAQSFNQVESFSLINPAFTRASTIIPHLPVNPINPGAPTTPFPDGTPDYGTIRLSDRLSVEQSPSVFQQNFQRYAWHAQVSALGQNLIYVGSHARSRYFSDGNQDAANIFPTATASQITHTESVDESHEIRLQNAERVAGIFDYVVGYFQTSNQPTTHLTSNTLLDVCGLEASTGCELVVAGPFLRPGGTPIDLPQSKTKEQSYFANLTAHLFDNHFELSGGLRHIKFTDHGQNLYIGCTDPTFSHCTPASPAVDNGFSKTIYNFTAKYRFNDDLMVYASTGTSVRPGAHAIGDFSASFSPNEQAHTITGPETSTSYEVGFKSDWLNKALTVNATYYHQTFENYAYRAPGNGIFYLKDVGGGVLNVANFNFISAVPVKVDGVEAEIDYHPNRHFYLDAGIDWSKSTIGNAELACNLPGVPAVPTVADLQAAFAPGEHLGVCTGGGMSANFSPEFSATLQGEYSHEVSDRAELFLRGLLSYHGSTLNDPTNQYDDIGSYAIVNAYIGVRAPDGAWSLTLYGKNLGNAQEITNVNAVPGSVSVTDLSAVRPPAVPSPIGSTVYTGQYGQVSLIAPREFGVNLRIAIGSR